MDEPEKKNAWKRNRAQRDADILLLTEMYVSGHTYAEIAAEIAKIRPYNLTIAQLSYDMRKLHEKWEATALTKINAEKHRQLAQLEVLEREAWRSFRSSKTPKSSQTVRKNGVVIGDGVTASGTTSSGVRKVDRDGDPHFLRVIMDVQERRAKLLGLDAPSRSEISGPNGRPIETADVSTDSPFSEEESRELLKRTYERTFGTSNHHAGNSEGAITADSANSDSAGR